MNSLSKALVGKFFLAIGIVACSSVRLAGAEPVLEQGTARWSPWSGYWWPLRAGGLVEPLKKYDLITGCHAALWEQKAHPIQADTPDWHGYCHAWAASAVMEPEPTFTRLIARGQSGSLPLAIGDQKGMLAACHTEDVANIYGQRSGLQDGSDDPEDLSPERLWQLLRLYVRDQGVPLILDIEAGPEVWNYPVFAYEVRYEPDSASAQQLVQMVLWMADNAAPDYVGLKLRRHTYTFTVALREGRVRVGSGRWVGLSEQDHPDFAWYPLIPKAENPEVDYAQVKKLLGFSPEGSPPSDAPPPSEAPSAPTDRPMPMPKPQASAPPEPKPPASQHQPSAPPEPKPPASQHQPSPGPGASTSPQGIQPQGSRPSQPSPPAPASQTPPAPPSAFPQAHPSVVLSPSELVALVGQRTSSFGLDITIDRFDGAHYDPGETFSIRGVSAQAGYLYLLHLDSQGQLTLLYPLPGQDNRIQAQTPFTIPGPGDRFAFRALPPAGLNRIKAIVTSRPLVLTGLQPPPPPAQRGGSSPPDWPRQTFRWHPTQRQQLQVYLDHYHRHRQLPEPFRSVDPRSLLGPFAQDEVTFYVEAAPQHFPPHPPSSPPENLPTGKPDKNPLKQKQGQSPQVSSSGPFHTPARKED